MTLIYTDSYGSSVKASVDISVNKKVVDASDIQLEDGPNLIYNGEEQTKTFTGKLPEYIDMKVLSGDTGKDAGIYWIKIGRLIRRNWTGLQEMWTLSVIHGMTRHIFMAR